MLDAAEAEFLRVGYAGATLAGVSARADVSTATLHKYYPSKRTLFGGVMERFWQVKTSIPPMVEGNPGATLRQIGLAYAALLLPDATPRLFRVVIAEAIQHPELGEELYQRGKKPYLAQLEAYLAFFESSGELFIPDIPIAVRQFLGMINDVIFWPRLLVADVAVSESEAARIVDSAVETFLARYRRR